MRSLSCLNTQHMPYKIFCPFSVHSSHEIHTFGFRGGNAVKLTMPQKFSEPLGLAGTTIEINLLSEGKYVFEISSLTLSSHGEQVVFVEKMAEYLSFIIARCESNPHYGTPFIQPIWFEFRAEYIPEEHETFHGGVGMRDALMIESTLTVDLAKKNLPGAKHSELLRFYFDGLRAEHKKSKYFHWFLVLEYLENSKRYRDLFAANRLFNEEESRILRDVADKMAGPKKGAILNLLSRTREFRSHKLLKMLEHLGIFNVVTFGATAPITEEMIKAITDGRNSLFHSGSEIPESVLWCQLFPLATLIVECVSSDPTCLES